MSLIRSVTEAILLLLVGFGGAVLQADEPRAMKGGTKSGLRTRRRPAGVTRNKVLNAAVVPHWCNNGDRFWYRRELASGDHVFILVDAVKGELKPAFDHERLATALSKVTGKEYRRNRLPIDNLDFADKGEIFWFKAGDRAWKCDPTDYRLTEEKPPAAQSHRGASF